MVMQTPMTLDEIELSRAAFEYLAAHGGAARGFRGQIEPAPSSQWFADRSVPLGINGQRLPGLFLQAADFYLDAVARWMQTGMDPIAGYALLRGAGAASAWAWWLLDPTVSGEIRRDRSLTEQLRSLLERIKAVAQALTIRTSCSTFRVGCTIYSRPLRRKVSCCCGIAGRSPAASALAGRQIQLSLRRSP
jgi:hypothetical protein